MIGGIFRTAAQMAAWGTSIAATKKMAVWVNQQARTSAAKYVRTASQSTAKHTLLQRGLSMVTGHVDEAAQMRYLERGYRSITSKVHGMNSRISSTLNSAGSKNLDILHRVVKDELAALPMNYTMYRIDKHRAVTPEDRKAHSNFLKYYVGTPMVASVGSGFLFEKHMRNFSARNIAMKAARKIGPNNLATGMDISMRAIAGANTIANKLAAMQRARLRTTETRSTLAMVGTSSPITMAKKFYSYYKDEVVRDPRGKSDYMVNLILDDHDNLMARHKAYSKGLSERNRKASRAYEATTEKEIKKLTRERLESYRDKSTTSNSFMNFMNTLADEFKDDRFRVSRSSRAITSKSREVEFGLTGTMPLDSYHIGPSGTGNEFDFGRLGLNRLKDSVINQATSGITGGILHLFGMRDILKSKTSEHAMIGSVISTSPGDPLYMPMAYHDPTGEAYAEQIAGKMLGIDYDMSSGKERKRVEAFLQSRMDVYKDHHGITSQFDQKSAFMKSAAHGELLMNAGEMIIQKPSGETSILAFQKAENGSKVARTFDIGFHEGKRLKFLKMSTENDSIPARLIRGHTGYEEASYFDKTNGNINIVHGPGKYNKVIDQDSDAKSIVYRLKQALDIGYSENQSFLSDALSPFRKHTDPRYPTTFFSKNYIGNPEFRKDVLRTGRSREDLVTFLRKQAEDTTIEFWVNGVTKSGGTDNFINKITETAISIDPHIGQNLTSGMINQHMTAKSAVENIDNFISVVESWDPGFSQHKIQKHFLQNDLDELHRIRSIFYGKGEERVIDIVNGVNSSKGTYYGGRPVSVSKLDEYNSMVLRLRSGQFRVNDPEDTGAISNILSKMDSIGGMLPVTNQQRSAWYASSHLSKAYHEVASRVRTAAIPSGDAALNGITEIEGILESLSSNETSGYENAYKDIKNYYKKRLRYSAFSTWDQDHRLKFDESMGARKGVYLIPAKSGQFGFVGKYATNYDSTGRQVQIAKGVMDAANISVMSMFHAFNRASSEMIGLGFDESQLSTPIQYFEKMLTQRILPFTGAYLGYTAADRILDQTMDGTPLGEGVTPFVSNMFAGLRTAAQGTLDMTGITTMSSYLEDLLPGAISSPMSGVARGIGPIAGGLSLGAKVGGPRGALTGGIIGSAVGALLGGGPLGVFGMWDISQSRREVIDELTGKKEVAIRKGRWWELCNISHTKVRTNRGILEIKDIVPGDTIVTHTGITASIIDTSHHDEDVTIVIKGSPFTVEDIQCTPDHPILIYKNELLWAHAKDIQPGDLLAYPLQARHRSYTYIYQYTSDNKPTLTESIDGKTQYTRLQNTKNGLLSKSSSSSVTVGQDGVLRLDFNLGLIIGHYLGDGNIYRSGDRSDPRGIEIAFSESEFDKALIVKNAIHDTFNLHSEIIHDSHRNMYRIRCLNSIIGEVFDGMFNGTSKTIPLWVYESKHDSFYKGILSGLLDSDGSISHGTNVVFNNTNIGIIHLFWQACIYLDIHGITHDKNRDYNTNNGYKDSYNVYLRNSESQKFKKLIPALKCDRIEDNTYISEHVNEGIKNIDGINYLLYKVTDIDSIRGTETFYDICVDHEDHSFLGLAVSYHNSPSAYEGGKINYFRPHIYALTRSDYKETPGFKDSLFTEMVGNLAPDLYAMKNYYSRPYPVTAGLLSNIPVFSNMIDLVTSPTSITKGLTLRGINMHEDDVSPTFVQRTGEKMGLSSKEVASNFINNSGIFSNTAGAESGIIRDVASTLGSISTSYSPTQLQKMPYTEMPMERSSPEWALGETLEGIKDIVGLRGFMLGTAFESITGRSTLFDFAPELASPVDIAGFQKEYWNMELGGLLGASEVIRRYVPHRRNSIQMFNPIRNTFPTWLPGYDYYQDFQHGDPYNVIQMGEARLPGPGYETLHDVDLTMPVIADILGEAEDSQAAFYLGLPDYMAKRNRDTDIAKVVSIQVVEDAKKAGELISDTRVIYDPESDVTASADAMIRSRYGGMTPVKVAPIGYGGESSLNAFLSLANIESGMLIEVDTENGGVKNRMIKRDLSKFERELKRSSRAKSAAFSQINKLEDEGKAFNLANSYSWLDRFKILADVGFYSKEYETAKNIVSQQIQAGIISGEQAANVQMIKEQVDQKKKSFSFSEYKFRDFGEGITPYTKARDRLVADEYGVLERIVGSGWERMTHLRNPLQVKMYHNTDALEEYERNVIYGKTMRMWQHPIEDYAKTYIYSGIGVDSPMQGAASWATAGYMLGGLPLAATMSVGGGITGLLNQTLGVDYVPERAQDVREMINQTDAVKYLRMRQLYDQTGDDKYLRRANSTMTGMATSGNVYDISGLGMGMGKPDRDYMDDIINNITRTNFRRATEILPDAARATIYSSIGHKDEAQGIMSQYAMEQGERYAPSLDSPVYDLNVSFESTVINTYEMEGMNAHDAGYGWYDQMAQMERMKATGRFPDASLYGSLTSRVMVKDAIRSLDKTQEIKKSLMGIASQVEVFEDGMDRVEVEIVMR